MITTFDDLVNYLNSVPRINRGGCAIAALVMYRWLKQRKEKSHIVYFYSSDRDTQRYRSENFKLRLGFKNAEPSACMHAKLEYKKTYYDSRGGNPFPSHKYHHRLPESVVVRTINEAVHWNEEFNREYIRKIEKKTGVDLSDIKEVVEIW